MIHMGIILLCALAAPVRADTPTDYVAKGGCVIRAQANVDRSYHDKSLASYSLYSWYSLEIIRTPKSGHHWDLTLAEDPADHSTHVTGTSRIPYGTKRYTTLHATLHQYDTYEERVCFRGLDLVPLPPPSGIRPSRPKWAVLTPRCLSLKEPVTLTTLSGISITLPAQGAETLDKVFSNFDGNANALFIQINTSPDKALVVLPKSSLWRKYGKPVRIQLECPPPCFMVSSMADNTFKTIALGLPNLETVMHLDALTLIIRQRVELGSVPISIRVPISRNTY